MVGNSSGGEPQTIGEHETACLKTVICLVIGAIVVVGLLGYGLISLLKDVF